MEVLPTKSTKPQCYFVVEVYGCTSYWNGAATHWHKFVLMAAEEWLLPTQWYDHPDSANWHFTQIWWHLNHHDIFKQTPISTTTTVIADDHSKVSCNLWLAAELLSRKWGDQNQASGKALHTITEPLSVRVLSVLQSVDTELCLWDRNEVI